MVATAHRGSCHARTSSSHGRSVVRRSDRIARAGPGRRRDRFPAAPSAGVPRLHCRCDHTVRGGHRLVPGVGYEIDAADPVRVRNRGVIARTMRRLWRNLAASAQHASRVWLSSAASIATGLSSRLGRMVAALRREVTRDAVARWVRAAAVALSGVPPAQVSPPARAGRLGRPRAAPGPTRPARVNAQAAESRDLHRGSKGASHRPSGPTAHPKPIHWSLQR